MFLRKPFYLCSGFMALLIFKQPDMGTMGIVVALMLVMYIIAGIPVSQIVKVVGAGVSC
jgi:cell division protein FtsW (lipid II flippase)